MIYHKAQLEECDTRVINVRRLHCGFKKGFHAKTPKKHGNIGIFI